jgi:hypothetical protein
LYLLLLSSPAFSLGLVDHPSIRALGPKAMSAHTLTSGPGPLTYQTMRPSQAH